MKKQVCLLLALLLLALTGCAAPTAPSAPLPAQKDAVTVVMAPTSEPTSGFDPAFGWGAGEHVHEPLIQSTLTITNPDLTIGYDLATAMSVSDDGLTWTVKLREGVLFTDGKPLTAADVAFTYNLVKGQSTVNDFTMLKNAQATDDTTVLFHLEKPFSIWPYTMAIVGILPEHCYDSATYGQAPIGSGRYLLKQWDRGQQIIFEANPNYYGDSPKMKKVTILFMEEDAAFLAAKAGQADLCYTAASYADQTVDGYHLLSCETVDNRGFNLPAVLPTVNENGVPVGNAVTADPAVRRAINIGVDRLEMIDNVLGGHGTPAYSVCDKMPWYNDSARVEYDLDGAIALLEEAGWSCGSDGIRQREGIRAAFTLLYPSGDSVRQTLAADFSNQLKKLGIEAATEGVGWDAAYERALSQPLAWGWGAHTPMELYNIYHSAPGSQSAEYSPYYNETVDGYMDAALESNDLESAYALWKKAQWDGSTGVTQQGDLPWVWLVNINHLYWVRDGLQVADQKIHPHGHGWSIVNNVDRWSWKGKGRSA